ncbi:MAG: hypothetical protein NTY71_01075 [Methanoregula sp.]|jgi:hypothetical protein|nr:hypothetical protein [Methanoregula sp.]
MPSGVDPRLKGKKGSGLTYRTHKRDLESGSPSGVRESYFGGAGNQKIETLLTDIVTRLERIEEKIDETVYPPESAIRPEYIRKVKKAQSEISRGKAKTYRSMDDFIQSLAQ